ncbi:MAG: MlaE family ABC transporter permease [Bacteroidota bacterium]
MQLLYHLGNYMLLLGKILRRPQNPKIYRQKIIIEMDNLGIDSLGIVVIISIFMGAVLTIQTAFNTDHPLLPIYAVGFATRQAMVLEFSPTIISLILAGKVGSRIASEIGTMRVTEQIDALEVMGINSAGYLILPKIIASMLINPILIIISMFLGIFGGYIAAYMTNVVAPSNFIYGILFEFSQYDVVYAMIKTVVFAFIIASVSGYYGYNTRGGALEVGYASTKAVVMSSIHIIIFNLVLTQLLLV